MGCSVFPMSRGGSNLLQIANAQSTAKRLELLCLALLFVFLKTAKNWGNHKGRNCENPKCIKNCTKVSTFWKIWKKTPKMGKMRKCIPPSLCPTKNWYATGWTMLFGIKKHGDMKCDQNGCCQKCKKISATWYSLLIFHHGWGRVWKPGGGGYEGNPANPSPDTGGGGLDFPSNLKTEVCLERFSVDYLAWFSQPKICVKTCWKNIVFGGNPKNYQTHFIDIFGRGKFPFFIFPSSWKINIENTAPLFDPIFHIFLSL